MAQEPRAQSFAISNFFLAHTGWNEWPGDFTRDKESQAESLSFTISTRWHEWPGVLEPPYASSATGSFAANTAFSNSIDSEESAGFSVDSRRLSFVSDSAAFVWTSPDTIRVSVAVTNLSNSAVPLALNVSIIGEGLHTPADGPAAVFMTSSGEVSAEFRLADFRDSDGATLERDTGYLVRASLSEGHREADALTAGNILWRSDVSTSTMEWLEAFSAGAGSTALVQGSFRYRDDVSAFAQLALVASSDRGLTWNQIDVQTVDGPLAVSPTTEWQTSDLTWHAGLDWKEGVSTDMQLGLLNTVSGEFVTSSTFFVDTRSLLRVLDLRTQFSSYTKPAVFLDTVPLRLELEIVPDWAGAEPGVIEFSAPTGRAQQDAVLLTRAIEVGGMFGPGGRLQVRLIDAEGNTGNWYDANFEVAQPPLQITGIELRAVTDEATIRYELRSDWSATPQPLVYAAPAIVDEFFPMLTGSAFGIGDTDLNIQFTLHENGSAVVLATGPFEIQLGEPLPGTFSTTIDLQYETDTDTWNVQQHEHDITSGVASLPTRGVNPPNVPISPYVPIGGRVEWSLSTLPTPTDSTDALAWDGQITTSLQGIWTDGSEILQGVNLDIAIGFAGEQEVTPSPANDRLGSLLVTGGEYRTSLLGFEALVNAWTFQWNEIGSASRSGGARANWQQLGRGYLAASDGIAGLHQHVYPYSHPTVASSGDEALLAWIGDDGTRTLENRTMLNVQLYDGSWQASEVLFNDGTADFAPAVAGSDDSFVVIWQNTAAPLSDTASIGDVARLQEIAVRHYDRTSDTWSETTTLTNDRLYDHSPHLAMTGDGSAMAIWTRNNSNNLVGTQAEQNVLMFAYYDPQVGWTTPGGISGALSVGPILDVDILFTGNEIYAVVAIDTDFDAETGADRELFLATFNRSSGTWAALQQLTADTAADHAPQLFMRAGAPWLIWLQEDDLVEAPAAATQSPTTITTPGGSVGNLDLISARSSDGTTHALIYPRQTEIGQQLTVLQTSQDGLGWLPPYLLSPETAFERTPTATVLPGDEILVVRNVAALADGSIGVIVPIDPPLVDVRRASQDDVALVADFLVDSSDLTSRFDSSVHLDGLNAAVDVTITNIGTASAPASSVSIKLDGNEVATREISALAPGQSESFTANWVLGLAPIAPLTLSAHADSGDAVTEGDETNNDTDQQVFLPDLTVASVRTVYHSKDKQDTTFVIENLGETSAASYTIRVVDSAGAPLTDVAGQVLSAGAESELTLALPTGTYVTVFADFANTVAESNESNNSRSGQGALGVSVTPSITPHGGVISRETSVTLGAALGSEIRYTVDGTTPTEASTLYTAAFIVDGWTIVKARTFATGYQPSPIASAEFSYEFLSDPPQVLTLAATAIAGEPLRAQLTVSGTNPGNSFFLAYTWSAAEAGADFGLYNGGVFANDLVAEFATPGTYTLTVMIEDDQARSGIDTIVITVPLDLDGDSLSDSWEFLYLPDLLSSRDSDPDADGVVNLVEFQSGGDPSTDERLQILTASPGTFTGPASLGQVNDPITVTEGVASPFGISLRGGIPPLEVSWFFAGNTASGDETGAQIVPPHEHVQHPAMSAAGTVGLRVWDTAGQTASLVWTALTVNDTDRLAPAPEVQVTPLAPRTTDQISLTLVSQGADPDGDAVTGHSLRWTTGNTLIEAAQLTAGNTAKHQQWLMTATAETDPYGAGAVTNKPATAAFTIQNTPPVVANRSYALDAGDGQTFNLGIVDPDLADGTDELVLEVLTDPRLGTISSFVPTTGTLRYTASRFRGGEDDLVYRVKDNDGAQSGSATATFSLGWTFSMTVAGGPDPVLRIGMEAKATNGFDVGTPRPDRGATPTTGNRAFFESPALDLASDYRPVAETGSWTMTVDTTHEAAGIELSWTASTLLTSGLYLLEVNEADAPLDATNLIAMADQQSLSIEPDVVRRFQILYGAVPYFVKQVLGWQVTAHPVTIEPVDLAGLRAQGLYGGFRWNGTTLVLEQDFQPGSGYFNFWPLTARTVPLTGILEPIIQSTLTPGWHMIGQRALPPFGDLDAGSFVENSDEILIVWSWDPQERAYSRHYGLFEPGVGYWVYILPLL